jgi:hypothetical protein
MGIATSLSSVPEEGQTKIQETIDETAVRRCRLGPGS